MIYGWNVPIVGHEPSHPLTVPTFLANLVLLDVNLNSPLWALQVAVLMAPFILLFYFVERRFGPSAVLAIAIIATPLSFTKSWLLWDPLSHNFFAFVLGLVVPTLGRELVQGLSPRAARLCVVMVVAAVF